MCVIIEVIGGATNLIGASIISVDGRQLGRRGWPPEAVRVEGRVSVPKSL